VQHAANRVATHGFNTVSSDANGKAQFAGYALTGFLSRCSLLRCASRRS
jgi:hypothetical protein